MKTINNRNTKLVIIARETHVAHNRTDIKDPSPITSLFEYILGKFNDEIYEEFERLWCYEAALKLKQMLEAVGFRPVYIFEVPIYEIALFVKVTDNLYAVIVPPEERDIDLPVIHPIYIVCYDKRIELQWIARLVTEFWLEKIRGGNNLKRELWLRITDGLDEVIIEFDFERRRAKCKRVPVYKSRKDKLLASSL